jgi:hypothetical protein
MSKHPIQEAPAGISDTERIRLLEVHLAQLWDQVWWLSLPVDRREGYKREGFTDPIVKFYED